MRILFTAMSTVLALLLSLSTATAQERTLNIASIEYPPFYGSELESNGFITEIIAEALSRSGYGLDVKFLPWIRAFEGTKAGKFDGLFTVWYRAEREADFVIPIRCPRTS